MPSFVYQARDAKGERVSGARDAASEQEARDALRAAGLFVTKLTPADSQEGQALLPEGSIANASTPVKSKAETKIATPNGETALPSRKWELAPPSEMPSVPRVSPPPTQAADAAPRPKFDPLRTPPLPREKPKPSSEEQQIESGSTETASTPVVLPPAKDVVLPPQALPPSPARYHLRSNSKDLSLFWNQMHSMLEAGVALSHAVTTLSTNAPNMGLRVACREMAPRIAAGTQFSELMKSYPGIFSPLMIGMIRAGEAGGFLDRMCKRLSEYSERDYHIEQTIKRETWYPKMIFLVALFIPTIVPAVVGHFRDNQDFWTLWIGTAWPVIFFLIVLGAALRFKNFFLPLTKHLKPLTAIIDQIKLLIPISGKTTRALATAKFCRALGALQAAGMGMRQTIDLASDACGNSAIAQSSRSVLPKLESGASMTDALESTRQFPRVAVQMLRTGESTGEFEKQLEKVADFLENDAETTIKQAVVVVGILMFLVVAIYALSQMAQMLVGTYENMIDEGIKLQE